MDADANPGTTELSLLMDSLGIPGETQSVILSSGWTTETIAHAAPSDEDWELHLAQLTPEPATFQPVSPLAAKLRLLRKRCAEQGNESQSAPSSSKRKAPELQDGEQSWVDSWAPKLDAKTTQSMKDQFLARYPGELLTEDFAPGSRLLAQVHAQATANDYAWIHWKYRLSERKQEDLQANRSSRHMRLETLSLQQVLVDEIPVQAIIPERMGLANVQSLFQLTSNVYALTDACHLAVIKAYHAKILKIASRRFPEHSGLRGPTISEIMFADQELWRTIREMTREGHTLNQALHEITEVRQDIPSYLQPRAAIGKGKGAGPSFTPQTKGFGVAPKQKTLGRKAAPPGKASKRGSLKLWTRREQSARFA